MKDKNKIVPRGKWLLVRPLEVGTKENEHGLLLPDNEEREQKSQGTVESVGEEVNGIEVGERVIYGTYAGENLKIREKDKEVDFKLLLDEDIIAFVR